MPTQDGSDRANEGQILVLFALAALVIIAMVGLVLDGGSTFSQRRSQQNAADLAALAGANAYLLTNDAVQATTAAETAAAWNGFSNGVNGVVVTVSFDYSNGAAVTVGISAPHPNAFTPAVGIESWEVSTTATAVSGFPDTGKGAAPFIGSVDVFDSNGRPKPQYGDSSAPFDFGETNGDVPDNANDFAWTNYGTGNVDTNEVAGIIQGTEVVNKTLQFGEYIGQENAGYHGGLFDDVDTYLSGRDMPVPVVDDNGNFQGWAMFHIVSASGGVDKYVRGYYLDGWSTATLTITTCAAGNCPRYLGAYVLKLID